MKNLIIFKIALLALLFLNSCGDDDPFEARTTTFNYQLHNGQAVPSAPYAGLHPNDFSASMLVEENEDGTATISVTLMNTVDGVTYPLHAHDAADPATTPNGTPYIETPNGDVFAQMAAGNGGSVTVSQSTELSYDEVTSDYAGFFVVHDPLQAISTTDISTYLVVGGFAREQASVDYKTSTFNYSFNEGQVAQAFAYTGTHPDNLMATIQVDELADSKSRVTVRLMNTIDGETYPTHAHDMADPATTPNGTPYIETPNSMVFASGITGNGDVAGEAMISNMSYDMITTSYDGFFVVHDPLQPVTTTDPTTYVVLGIFAR